ncbi:MAG: hypothetical protein M1830_001616 [Pleopsidium flavum]|nr:MAG: hypothetical protein M1830_001616 [Pleopsidium flavum]
MAGTNAFHQMMTAAPNSAPPNRTIPPKKSTAGRAQQLQTTIGGPGILKPESDSAFGERVGPDAQLEDAAMEIHTLRKRMVELERKRQDLELDLPRMSIEELKRLAVTNRETLRVLGEEYAELEKQSLAGRKGMTSAAPESLSTSDWNSDAYLRHTNEIYAIEADILPVPDIVKTQANDITLLLGKTADLTTKLGTLDEEKTDIANELARLRLDNNDLVRRIKVSEDKVEEVQRSMEDLQRSHDNTKDELTKARDDNTSLRRELAGCGRAREDVDRLSTTYGDGKEGHGPWTWVSGDARGNGKEFPGSPTKHQCPFAATEIASEHYRCSHQTSSANNDTEQFRSSDGQDAEEERRNLAEPSGGASKRPPLPAGDAGPPTKRPRMQSSSASSGSPSTSQPQHANNQRRPEPSASSGSPSTSQSRHANNQRCPEPSASSGSPSTSQPQHANNQRRPEPLVASGSVPANLTAALPEAPRAAPAPLAIDYRFLEEGA